MMIITATIQDLHLIHAHNDHDHHHSIEFIASRFDASLHLTLKYQMLVQYLIRNEPYGKEYSIISQFSANTLSNEKKKKKSRCVCVCTRI